MQAGDREEMHRACRHEVLHSLRIDLLSHAEQHRCRQPRPVVSEVLPQQRVAAIPQRLHHREQAPANSGFDQHNTRRHVTVDAAQLALPAQMCGKIKFTRIQWLLWSREQSTNLQTITGAHTFQASFGRDGQPT